MVSWILSTLLVTAVAGQADCTIVYFGAPQCGPCEQLAPVLSQLMREGWDIRRVDATQDSALAQQYRIQNLPTVVILHQRREVDRIVGAVPYEQLHSRFARAAARGQSSSGTALARAQSNAAEPTAAPPMASPAASSLVVRGQSPAAAGFPLMAAGSLASSAPASQPAEPSPAANAATPAMNLPIPSQLAQASLASKSVSLNIEQAIARASAATVRIIVEEANTKAFGTGTIIDVHGAEALVLTCGHIFRDMKPGSRLSVDLFAGTDQEVNIAAQLVDFKATEEDIGLLSIQLPTPIEPVTILPRTEKLQVGQRVFSFGCDHGSDPSRRDTQISHIDRFLGPANVEIIGAPALGRSGGGLFDQQGQLIGVCNAADTTDNEGIYAAAEVVYAQIERLGMTHLFDPSASAATSQLAAVEPNRAPRTGQAAQPVSYAPVGNAIAAAPSPDGTAAQAAPINPAALEVICIVRDSNGKSHVLNIPNPSADLMQAIQQHSSH